MSQRSSMRSGQGSQCGCVSPTRARVGRPRGSAPAGHGSVVSSGSAHRRSWSATTDRTRPRRTAVRPAPRRTSRPRVRRRRVRPFRRSFLAPLSRSFRLRPRDRGAALLSDLPLRDESLKGPEYETELIGGPAAEAIAEVVRVARPIRSWSAPAGLGAAERCWAPSRMRWSTSLTAPWL
jgi:hypothetical protein